jgi:hypothetical protein
MGKHGKVYAFGAEVPRADVPLICTNETEARREAERLSASTGVEYHA